ncbi:MAG: YlxR family protein [Clostridiales bacterium]|nr:YlxR family protein [Clostridiales bacterium]
MHIKQDRRCVACHETKQQKDLLRVTRIDGMITIDSEQKLGGRGAYICKDRKCIELTIKKHLLNRAFKSNLEHSIYEKLGAYEQNN